MTSPLLERVNAALATVNDPEIRRPITEIGMVDDVSIDDDGPDDDGVDPTGQDSDRVARTRSLEA